MQDKFTYKKDAIPQVKDTPKTMQKTNSLVKKDPIPTNQSSTLSPVSLSLIYSPWKKTYSSFTEPNCIFFYFPTGICYVR